MQLTFLLTGHWSQQEEALCQPAEIPPDNVQADGVLLLWVMMLVPTTLEHWGLRF